MSIQKPLCVLLAVMGIAPAIMAAEPSKKSKAPAAAAVEPAQKSLPPVAQAWVDLATYSGGIPAMASGGVGGMIGSFFRGNTPKAGGNVFGNTQIGTAGRWMDVTLLTRKNPNLMTGQQLASDAAKFGDPLRLAVPPDVKPDPAPVHENTPVDPHYEMPKGKIYMYWGCSAEVRKGQPLVLDMAKMDPAQMAKFFQNRGATTRVPGPGPGRPVWPNKTDDRMVPAGASLVGEHAFSGEGVPDGFKLAIDAQHDLMPVIDVKRSDSGNAVLFAWQPMEQARGWFISSMGARVDAAKADKGEMEMVFWTSSDLPDMGMGLLNYQPNASVDKWIKEKVVLPARTTECMAPKEAVTPMSMTRMIAYGDELNVAYPPRPKNPKITWEPEWSAKVRLKSVATLMPGMGDMAMGAMGAAGGAPGQAQGQPNKTGEEAVKDMATEEVKKTVIESVFKSLFKR